MMCLTCISNVIDEYKIKSGFVKALVSRTCDNHLSIHPYEDVQFRLHVLSRHGKYATKSFNVDSIQSKFPSQAPMLTNQHRPSNPLELNFAAHLKPSAPSFINSTMFARRSAFLASRRLARPPPTVSRCFSAAIARRTSLMGPTNVAKPITALGNAADHKPSDHHDDHGHGHNAKSVEMDTPSSLTPFEGPSTPYASSYTLCGISVGRGNEQASEVPISTLPHATRVSPCYTSFLNIQTDLCSPRKQKSETTPTSFPPARLWVLYRQITINRRVSSD